MACLQLRLFAVRWLPEPVCCQSSLLERIASIERRPAQAHQKQTSSMKRNHLNKVYSAFLLCNYHFRSTDKFKLKFILGTFKLFKFAERRTAWCKWNTLGVTWSGRQLSSRQLSTQCVGYLDSSRSPAPTTAEISLLCGLTVMVKTMASIDVCYCHSTMPPYWFHSTGAILMMLLSRSHPWWCYSSDATLEGLHRIFHAESVKSWLCHQNKEINYIKKCKNQYSTANLIKKRNLRTQPLWRIRFFRMRV